MDIKVRTQEKEILCSGSLIIPHGDYAEFSIKNLRFRLSFNFHNDDNRSFYQSVIVQTEHPRDSYMEIRGYNFKDTFFNILTKPIPLAQQDGKNLYLGLVVSSVNKRQDPDSPDLELYDMLVNYTWYQDVHQQRIE